MLPALLLWHCAEAAASGMAIFIYASPTLERINFVSGDFAASIALHHHLRILLARGDDMPANLHFPSRFLEPRGPLYDLDSCFS